jgi:hypothetical protein
LSSHVESRERQRPLLARRVLAIRAEPTPVAHRHGGGNRSHDHGCVRAASTRGGGGVDTVTGSTAADNFVFDQKAAGSFMTVMNFDGSNDKIALDTTNSTFTGNKYVLQAALANNTNIKAVADSDARIATSLASSGKGGFVYQQDTGELYYSDNGAFTTGGTLIGVITTDGATAWTYDFTKFMEV